ncbi:MAG: DUF1559 domain-containing protein [Planctomycetales bacterium]|nr:DUF1559 domain-containing protein [Planctomycetales bacterium]
MFQRGANWTVLLASLGLSVGGVLLLWPSIPSAHYAAHLRRQRKLNMQQIAIAIYEYAQSHGRFPPAFTTDQNGNRLHSWRTLILPEIGEGELFAMIDLTKPWDAPENARARHRLPECYQSLAGDAQTPVTVYLAILGEGTAFDRAEGRPFAESMPQWKSTISFIEGPKQWAAHWMAPVDATLDEFLLLGSSAATPEEDTLLVGFADAHVERVPIAERREYRRERFTP